MTKSNESLSARAGNVLGSARAENDSLLDAAFIETAEFRSLAYTKDFHVVVGRRGTGKSALFKKLQGVYQSGADRILLEGTATEHKAMAILDGLQTACKRYEHARAVSKILWKGAILTHLAREIVVRRNAHLRTSDEWIRDHIARWRTSTIYDTVAAILRVAPKESIESLASNAANSARVDDLEDFVSSWLEEERKTAFVLIDRLDEGWFAEPLAVGVLGGLIVAAVELSEHRRPVHVVSFVRDNMFRALAHYDGDFSRNIEDTSLRLKWTEDSLFFFVTQRISKAFGISESKDARIWDRFAQNELKGRAGFRDVLKHTLYRPRDLLTLLNRAYHHAQQGQRTEIIPADIEDAALDISRNRLDDLIKEYEQVLPGTQEFVRSFQGSRDQITYGEAIERIEGSATEHIDAASYSMAVLGTPEEVFVALYSIGFIGIEAEPGEFTYCHDGTRSSTKTLSSAHPVAIHPCYARALNLEPSGTQIEVRQYVSDETLPDRADDGNDEVKQEIVPKLRDQRTRQLGKVLVDLDQIQPGAEDARKFEEWVLRAIKILFSGSLSNAQLNLNKSDALRRDVIATNTANSGFWKRVRDDYKCRQVVFEAKNYSELGPDDFNQAVAYGGQSYGNASFIVNHGELGLDHNERGHIKSRYYGKQHLIIVLPASVLARCIRKQRSGRRQDYTEDTLGKLLDTYERSYLGEDSGRKRRRGRRRRHSGIAR